jgi:hypothetical protein
VGLFWTHFLVLEAILSGEGKNVSGADTVDRQEIHGRES